MSLEANAVAASETAAAHATLAKEQTTQASAALRAAAANRTNEATLLRGAGATALSAAGLRGATLAASAPFLVGAAIATILAKSAAAAGSFQRQLQILKDVSGATEQQLKSLSDTAIALGNDLSLPAVSANDAALALTHFVQSGFTVRQSLQAVRAALLLSVSAQTDVGTATEITAKTLEAFHLPADQAVRVVNSLTNAANHAEGIVLDFSAAIGQVAAVAAKGGLSLEDTSALLAVFAKGGFTGAAAGTALRQAFIRLENPTKNTSAILKDLAVNLRDAQGNLRPDLFLQFAAATRGMGKDLQDALAATVFGARAVRGFDIAISQGAAGLRIQQKAQEDQTAAQKLAAAQTQGLAGHLEELKKTAVTTGVQIGQGLVPAFTGLTNVGSRSLLQLSGIAKGAEEAGHQLSFLSVPLRALSESFGAGLVPILALVAGVKAFGVVAGVITGIEARWVGTSAELVAAQTDLAAAQAVNVRAARIVAVAEANAAEATAALAAAQGEEAVAAGEVAVAQTEAAVAATRLAASEAAAAVSAAESTVAFEASLAASEGFAASLAATLGPLGLVVAGAVGLGIAIKLLGSQESATKKATDELAVSAQHLTTAFNPQNIVLERKALEDLVAAEQAAAAEQDKLLTNRGIGRTSPSLGADEQRNAATATADFVKNLRAQAAAVKDLDPLLAHNRNLLADFAKTIGTLPSQKEIKVFADNKQAKTSLQDILDAIAQLGPRGAQDAFRAGRQLQDQFKLGFGRGAFTAPDIIVGPQTLGQLTVQIRALFRTLDLKGPLSDKVRSALDQMFQQLAALPGGKERLFELGKELGDSLTAGLTSTQKDQVNAAEQAIKDAAAAGQQQVDAAISSAKSNLGSIAQQLASSVGQVLDARATAAIASLDKSALGKEIVALQAQLDKSNTQAQREQLVLAVRTATDPATAGQKIAELAAFDAQTKLATDQKILQSKKDTILKTTALEKQAVQNSITAAADAFTKGQITISRFTTTVLDTLRKQHIDFHNVGGDLGNTLGKAFFSAANAQLTAFILQANELIGSTGGSGTTQVPTTNIQSARDAAARALQDAKTSRDNLLKAIRAHNGKSVGDILTDINKALHPVATNRDRGLTNPALGGSGRSKAARANG